MTGLLYDPTSGSTEELLLWTDVLAHLTSHSVDKLIVTFTLWPLEVSEEDDPSHDFAYEWEWEGPLIQRMGTFQINDSGEVLYNSRQEGPNADTGSAAHERNTMQRMIELVENGGIPSFGILPTPHDLFKDHERDKMLAYYGGYDAWTPDGLKA